MSRRALLLLPLFAATAGCGWHAGLVAPDADSVGVEVFPTRREILQRELEIELNDALTRALVDLVETPVAAPGDADVVVRGEIVEYKRRSGVRNEDNDLLESGVLIVVEAELVERRTGVVRVPRQRARIWSGYVLDEDETLDNERRARERAFRNIAETLVLQLFLEHPPVETATDPNAAPPGA